MSAWTAIAVAVALFVCSMAWQCRTGILVAWTLRRTKRGRNGVWRESGVRQQDSNDARFDEAVREFECRPNDAKHVDTWPLGRELPFDARAKHEAWTRRYRTKADASFTDTVAFATRRAK